MTNLNTTVCAGCGAIQSFLHQMSGGWQCCKCDYETDVRITIAWLLKQRKPCLAYDVDIAAFTKSLYQVLVGNEHALEIPQVAPRSVRWGEIK